MSNLSRSMTRSLLITAACLSTASGWAGQPNTMSENRGFDTCLKKATRESATLHVDRTFYTNTYAHSRQYYVNGHASVDGKWTPVRVACQTNRIGSKVVAFRLEEGHFAARYPASVARQ